MILAQEGGQGVGENSSTICFHFVSNPWAGAKDRFSVTA